MAHILHCSIAAQLNHLATVLNDLNPCSSVPLVILSLRTFRVTSPAWDSGSPDRNLTDFSADGGTESVPLTDLMRPCLGVAGHLELPCLFCHLFGLVFGLLCPWPCWWAYSCIHSRRSTCVVACPTVYNGPHKKTHVHASRGTLFVVKRFSNRKKRL